MSTFDEKQMDIDGADDVIDSCTVKSVPSCSSSILNSSVNGDDFYEDDDDFEDGVNVTIMSATTTADKTAVAISASESSLPGNQQQIKLNGAARKRYKRMIADGVDSKEAYRLARIPWQTPVSEKRSRNSDLSGSNSSGGNPPKKQNFCSNSDPKNGSNNPPQMKFSVQNRLQLHSNVRSGRVETIQSDNKPSFSSVLQYVRVGIVPKDYPDVELSSQQLLATRKAILAKVVQQRKELIKPKFGQCSFRPGHLILVCKNQETADWLKGTASTLSIPGEVELVALDEKSIPRPEIIIGFFPVSAEDSTDEILALLESQNDGLNTDEWRIKERNTINELHAELIFTVDGASMDTIKKCEFLLDYKFGTAPLRRKLPPRNKASNQTTDGSDEIVGNSGMIGKPAEQPTAPTGSGGLEQTKIPLQHLKNTGDMACDPNPGMICLPGTSGIGNAGNRLSSKKIPKEPRNNKSGLNGQGSPGSKGALALGSKRHAKSSSANLNQTIDNENPIHKNKYIVKYIKSLGDRGTNKGGIKAPQESDTVEKQGNGK